jgi:POT family proton-dependent oligopeptide transporter
MADLAAPARTTLLIAHPPGLTTLFMTELWERMSFYGLRTILVLFLVAPVASGGIGLDDKSAALIYGLMVSLFTFLAMFAGWLGDAVLGAQRAVLAGGLTIIAGLVLMVLAASGVLPAWAFFLGLWVDVCGVALLKTNVPVLLAELYPDGGAQRDAGFSLYYMGINIGTLLGTAAVPLVASAFGWPWGFAAALLGMVFGVGQFVMNRARLQSAGQEPSGALSFGGRRWAVGATLTVFALLTLGVAAAIRNRILDVAGLAHLVSGSYGVLIVAFLAYLLIFVARDADARKRVVAMAPIGLGASLFVIGFDQAGSSLNLFAERFTDRSIGPFEVPAGVFQSAYPLGVIIFSPVFAVIWTALARRGVRPTVLAKFGVGLVFMAVGFFVMYCAAHAAHVRGTATPIWLLTTYLLHTFGDLCVGPIGISAATRMAPRQLVGQFVGLWSVGLAMGHSLSGYVAAGMDTRSLSGMAQGFHGIFVMGLMGAGLLFVLSPVVRRLLGPKIDF